MKTGTKVIVGLLLIGILGIVGFRITGNVTAEPGKYDNLAQCITDAGATMYGAYWCPHCADQKKSFGKSFDYVDYVECDPRGNNANPQLCDAKGIEGYPTWIFADGSRASGNIPLRELSLRTGCEFIA